MAMTLAEALTIRSDLHKRLEQLKQRLQRNAKVQDGEAPAENPGEMLGEFERHAAEFERIVARINGTNARTMFDETRTLTDALAERDVLRLREGTYRELAKAATVTQSVSTRSEVRFRATVVVADIQRKADSLAQQLRILDLKIQQQNWRTNLL